MLKERKIYPPRHYSQIHHCLPIYDTTTNLRVTVLDSARETPERIHDTLQSGCILDKILCRDCASEIQRLAFVPLVRLVGAVLPIMLIVPLIERVLRSLDGHTRRERSILRTHGTFSIFEGGVELAV
ncbi:hypothetical protein L873DRAFT_188226 [Choiromyces venosus 120613-1]|uniref:Uncharacterized protein n=1 Tax=Choiromyces venosus 120613-1 TaxID=1336337 RepID=A0A3N4J2Y6_9PEZI|nr:hypothetical protein L873DRAFT_188226 [Choiromyces venosus 120613-1]